MLGDNSLLTFENITKLLPEEVAVHLFLAGEM